MAFLGGAECSTAGNPLSQFTKHVQDDKSLQRDRVVGGSGSQFESFRTQRPMGQNDHMMDEFLTQQPDLIHHAGQPFAMEQMRREIEGYADASRSKSQSPPWAAEYSAEQPRFAAQFQNQRAGSMVPAGFSPADFQRFQQAERTSSPQLANPLTRSPMAVNGSMSSYQRPYTRFGGYGQGMGMAPQQRYGPMSRERSFDAEAQSKGKSRVIELDDQNWEQQFAAIDAAGTRERDLDAEAQEAMEREMNDIDRSVPHEQQQQQPSPYYDAGGGDFESIWRGIQAETRASRSLLHDDDDDGEPLGFQPDDLLNPWGDFDANLGLGTHGGGGFRDPQLGDYLFEDENPFRATAASPFDQGMQIMRAAGNLSLAALAFEAAVQQEPRHLDAWLQLGSAQAQNEKETAAIRALEQALRLDPDNLAALMGLAVSFTNEGYDSTAYRTLERWLSVKYPAIVAPAARSAAADLGFTDRHQLHDRVTALFLRAARLSPDGERMDPDVQVGLGVLFYGAEAYDKAVDCFEAALASAEVGSTTRRPSVHLLWNRLGATLANSGRSEEAIAAYEKALTLNPNFVRARYNLGVSCINVGCFAEAAQHLLGALAMHRVGVREGVERVRGVVGDGGGGGGTGEEEMGERELEGSVGMNESGNLYDTLRRVFGQMGRRDLSDMVGPGMDLERLRGEFEF